jgi:hypothetical protein
MVFATVGHTDTTTLAKHVTIPSFSPTAFISTHPTFSFSVKNDYITHFTAKPFLTLTPLFGEKKTYLPEEKHVLPGSTRTWTYTIPQPLSLMIYSATLAVSIGNGQQIITYSYLIVIPKLFMSILMCMLVLSILFIGRKRIVRAVSILTHAA